MKTFVGKVRVLGVKAVDMILPPRCVLSGEPVERQGMIAPQVWAGLDFIETPFCASCGLPFSFEVEEGLHCTACIDYAPPFESARAALRYNDTSRDLILGFKHADKTFAVKAFSPWLRRAGAEMLREADLLVPVPLHYRRLVARRYNQAALIAFELSRETGIACAADALLRVRATASQGHMNAGERHKNVKRAFAVNPRRKEILEGKNVILIDDVYTTGATVKECTKALLKGGARTVHVLTLARVVRDGEGG
ncbi:MAG: ComF family protein [Alphaproteobacteria bacterium]|nr:ComF family protein [Alphaproteobacteria bacterium]